MSPHSPAPPTGPPGADALLSAAAERVRAARPEFAGRDLSTPAALRAVRAEIAALDAADPAGAPLAVCVVGDLDLPSWARESCRFALAVDPAAGAAWRRAFTRTVFLAGRPANLRDRFAFDHVADDATAAWAGPAPEPATAGLRRLLKTFDGARAARPWPPAVVEVPGAGPRPPVHREVYAATAQVTVARLLVHLNHLLAEAVLDGLIAPGDRLTLRSVPRLAGVTVPFAALRIDTDAQRPDGLQALAGLTEER
ncbi:MULTISPECIES: DUF6182 family protein [Streptomycetaceae]|uniref:Uncharacterized protein n=1 Tax=Streptantibioticus cattleyicolor (strain ATCC 35852 / DSM 46488 / JCM 4925 / NBRC 14057 / NRRL 8057) TaxID=1003195 RepID=F8JS78_STREN|nr:MULTISPECIES: DUF6182 family protein [Streptomycetaceae]AEW94189.1 hypothetical protein SCATT_18180 [Streptantibioticus cattleyicolor NRRL 8057 = DSM 46488]MYS58849.1 hypothetical protein [Streptomyces sp. SID5468]CCB74543.1 protein of unknown function [Streptantibioticus cattleyicolor NRRL 8057 = DSM 46488]